MMRKSRKAEEQKIRKSGGGVPFGLLVLCVFGSLLTGACGPLTMVIGTGPADQRLKSTVVESEGKWFADRVAMVDISGLIMNAEKPGLLREGENPVSVLHEKLEKARDDDRVKALVLRLNTPGGTVTASDSMYRQVLRFKRRSGKPVVALMMDVTASGGYYVACAADVMVAYPTTVTGSIGVILQTISLKPALDRIGIRTDAITSGDKKDAGSWLSVLTPEKRAVLQALVDDFYERFVAVVRQARPGIEANQFERLTDGRILSGEQAAQVGLVDQVGDLYTAFDAAKQLAGITSADLVLYHRPLQYVGSPYAGMGLPRLPMLGHEIATGGTQINIAQVNLTGAFADAPVGFFYLWRP